MNPDGSLANWVVTNIENNFYALLIAGATGLTAAFIIGVVVNRGVRGTVEKLERGTLASLGATAAVLLLGWWLIENWDEFSTRAHGFAAVVMFVFLIGAVGSRAFAHRSESGKSWYFRLYTTIGLLMGLGGLGIWLLRIGDEHTVFVLEAYEIVLFAVFWLVQTWENWDEGPLTPASP